MMSIPMTNHHNMLAPQHLVPMQSKPYSRKVKVGRMTPQRIDRIKELAEAKGIPYKTVESILQQFVSEEDPYVEISLSSNSAVRKGKDGQVTYIKRPLNSFMLYRKSQTQSALAYAAAANLKLNHQSISRIIGLMWQTESGETKEEFARFAGEEKELHRAMHPDYKFSPQKKNKKGHPEVQAVTRRPLNPPAAVGMAANPAVNSNPAAISAANPSAIAANPAAISPPAPRPPSQPMMEMQQNMAYVSPTSRHVPPQTQTSPLHHQSPLQTAAQYQYQPQYSYPYEKRESFDIKRESMDMGMMQQQQVNVQQQQQQQQQQQVQQQQVQQQHVQNQQQQHVQNQQQQQQQHQQQQHAAQHVQQQQQQQVQQQQQQHAAQQQQQQVQQQQAQAQQVQQAQQAQQQVQQQAVQVAQGQQVQGQQVQQGVSQGQAQSGPPQPGYQYNQTYPQHQYHYPMQQGQQQQQHPGLPMPMQHHMENNMPYYQVPTGYNYSYTNMPAHSHPMN